MICSIPYSGNTRQIRCPLLSSYELIEIRLFALHNAAKCFGLVVFATKYAHMLTAHAFGIWTLRCCSRYCPSSPSAPSSHHKPSRELDLSGLRQVGIEPAVSRQLALFGLRWHRACCRPPPALDCCLALATVCPDLAFASFATLG